jgi:hypothetical protein
VGPRAGLDDRDKSKALEPDGNGTTIVRSSIPKCSHYINCAILTPILISSYICLFLLLLPCLICLSEEMVNPLMP